jgi:cytochrome b561
MKWINTRKNWGLISQIFHWGMLLLIILQYTLAYTMVDMPASDQKWALFAWHKQIGVTLFLLVCLRLWWRTRNPIPEDSLSTPQWDHLLRKINIGILYFLLFAFPLSGLLMTVLGGHSVNYFGLFTIPPLPNVPQIISEIFLTIHIWISYLLYLFVGAHILGALYHHFIVRDNVLIRMLKPN